MATYHPHAATPDVDSGHQEFESRLDSIGGGVFLLMSGVLWLMAGAVPSGTWLVGTGVLLLALNAVRYFRGMRPHLFTLVLGILALAGGLADFANVRLPLFALALVAFGALLLVKPFARHGG